MEVIRSLALLVLALLSAIVLQGCQFDVPVHFIGNWEAKTSYLNKYQFVPPGEPKTRGILNSCNNPNITTALQCNGHGQCRDWFEPSPIANRPQQLRLTFCECNLYWADPECRTPRKSQITAFTLSLFFGFFGLDQFYLGYPIAGLGKLVTIGGGGVVYLYDLVRIGSSPILTKRNFRVAADLPHFAFVLGVVSAMFFYGFLLSFLSIRSHRFQKAHDVLMIRVQAEEEEQPMEKEEPFVRHIRVRQPLTRKWNQPIPFTGYGTTLGPGSMAATLPLASVPLPTMPLPPGAIPPGSISPVIFSQGSVPPSFPPGALPPSTMPPAFMTSTPPASMGPAPSMVPAVFTAAPRTSVIPPGPPIMATASLHPVPSTVI